MNNSSLELDDARRMAQKRDNKMNELKKYSNLSYMDINRSQSGKEKRNLLRPKRVKENFMKPRQVLGPKNLCVTKIDMENRFLRESRGSLHHNPSILTMA